MRKRTNAGRGGSTMKSKLMHNLGLKIMAGGGGGGVFCVGGGGVDFRCAVDAGG